MENYARADNTTRENDLHGIRSSQEKLDIICIGELSQLLESQPIKWQKGSPSRRKMHRVPPQLRQKQEQSKHLYDPVFVSFGPYHHGRPELHKAEEIKYLCLDWCVEGNEDKKCIFYSKVFEKIDEIRGCYAEESKYDDKALALMMLLDACFIISYMANGPIKERNNETVWYNYLGAGAFWRFMIHDITLLENQIPFQVIKLIITLQYEEEEDAKRLVPSFLSWFLASEPEQTFRILGEDKEPPLHLLEACWRVMTTKSYNEAKQESLSKSVSNLCWWARGKKHDETATWIAYNRSLSVTDLKAKGIHFRPSSSYSLKDITFKSHALHGEIQLPIQTVSEQTKIFLSNMIAYELSPEIDTDLSMLSYTNFMKSLIATPEDVKELQDKKILANMFANDEQVVKLFEEIDTFGIVNVDIFGDVKHRIGEHCSSKAKTWMVDLINTRFDSPWTAIALLAATFLLCLTFIQTYFTIHPAN